MPGSMFRGGNSPRCKGALTYQPQTTLLAISNTWYKYTNTEQKYTYTKTNTTKNTCVAKVPSPINPSLLCSQYQIHRTNTQIQNKNTLIQKQIQQKIHALQRCPQLSAPDCFARNIKYTAQIHKYRTITGQTTIYTPFATQNIKYTAQTHITKKIHSAKTQQKYKNSLWRKNFLTFYLPRGHFYTCAALCCWI